MSDWYAKPDGEARVLGEECKRLRARVAELERENARLEREHRLSLDILDRLDAKAEDVLRLGDTDPYITFCEALVEALDRGARAEQAERERDALKQDDETHRFIIDTLTEQYGILERERDRLEEENRRLREKLDPRSETGNMETT